MSPVRARGRCAAGLAAAVLLRCGLPSPALAQSPPPALNPPPAQPLPPAHSPPLAAAPSPPLPGDSPAAPAAFAILGDQTEPRTAWRYVHSRFPLPKAKGLAGLLGLGGDRSFDVHAIVLPAGRYAARLVDQPQPSFLTAPPISEITRRGRALVGVNGGYFDPDFNPVGLYVLGGIERRPYRQRQLLSGIVAIDRSGRLEIRTEQAPYDDARYALQCGPLLIDPGGEIGIKPSLGPEARRTVLAHSRDGRLVVIATTAVTLRTLAEALHRHPDGFGVAGIERALNLDGGPSTAMTALFTQPPLRLEAQTPVRTALLFAARVPRRPARSR